MKAASYDVNKKGVMEVAGNKLSSIEYRNGSATDNRFLGARLIDGVFGK